MSAHLRWVRRPFIAVKHLAYLCLHGEDDMVQVYGRNPNGGDSEALRLGSSNVAAAIANPGGGGL
jgi:hypothetical protein